MRMRLTWVDLLWMLPDRAGRVRVDHGLLLLAGFSPGTVTLPAAMAASTCFSSATAI